MTRMCEAPRCNQRATCGAYCRRCYWALGLKARDDARKTPYRGLAWQRMRALVLREQPVCAACRRAPSVDVDHIVALRDGGSGDRGNLRGLCRSCHSVKTGTRRARGPAARGGAA